LRQAVNDLAYGVGGEAEGYELVLHEGSFFRCMRAGGAGAVNGL
jgi:hypothetical protein